MPGFINGLLNLLYLLSALCVAEALLPAKNIFVQLAMLYLPFPFEV